MDDDNQQELKSKVDQVMDELKRRNNDEFKALQDKVATLQQEKKALEHANAQSMEELKNEVERLKEEKKALEDANAQHLKELEQMREKLAKYDDDGDETKPVWFDEAFAELKEQLKARSLNDALLRKSADLNIQMLKQTRDAQQVFVKAHNDYVTTDASFKAQLRVKADRITELENTVKILQGQPSDDSSTIAHIPFKPAWHDEEPQWLNGLKQHIDVMTALMNRPSAIIDDDSPGAVNSVARRITALLMTSAPLRVSFREMWRKAQQMAQQRQQRVWLPKPQPVRPNSTGSTIEQLDVELDDNDIQQVLADVRE